MEKLPLLILGSHRKNSDTLALVEKLMDKSCYHLADLLSYSLAPYDYTQNYPAHDDFHRLVKQILAHRFLILATPVYWYSMSGRMKTFFDRLTDLITSQKPLGRQLRGKQVFVLAAGADAELPPGFLRPFQLSCQYLGMEFKGSLYHSTKKPAAAAEFQQAKKQFHSMLQQSLQEQA